MVCKTNICPLARLAHLDPLIFHYFLELEVRCSQCGNVQVSSGGFNLSEVDNSTYKCI